jgi:hypothetical protein
MRVNERAAIAAAAPGQPDERALGFVHGDAAGAAAASDHAFIEGKMAGAHRVDIGLEASRRV